VVARIYAELLAELGVLPASEVVETSGAAMVIGGVSELKKQLEKLEEGGVLFIDEAYQINPKTNPMGAQVGSLQWLSEHACTCEIEDAQSVHCAWYQVHDDGCCYDIHIMTVCRVTSNYIIL
jgi:hypothetical protein